MKAEVYVGATLEEKAGRVGRVGEVSVYTSRRSTDYFSRHATSKLLQTIAKLQPRPPRKETDFNSVYPVKNKVDAFLANIPYRFRQAAIGMFPGSMQEEIARYRNEMLGLDEKPSDYVKYSVGFSYPLAALKIAAGLGLLSIPVIATGGTMILAWGAYLCFVENPLRLYLRRKGKPLGVFIPWEGINQAARLLGVRNGKQERGLELTEEGKKSLEKILLSSNKD